MKQYNDMMHNVT